MGVPKDPEKYEEWQCLCSRCHRKVEHGFLKWTI